MAENRDARRAMQHLADSTLASIKGAVSAQPEIHARDAVARLYHLCVLLVSEIQVWAVSPCLIRTPLPHNHLRSRPLRRVRPPT